MAKSTGYVLKPRRYIGSAEPPATALEGEARGLSGVFAEDGKPDWVQLSTGLWYPYYDGDNSYISMTDTHSRLNFTSEDFAIFGWVNIFDTSARMLFCRGLLNTDGYYLIALADGQVGFYTMHLATEHRVSTTDAGALVAGTWAHIGVIRSGTSVIIIKNAVDVTTTSGTHLDPLTSARTARFGVYDDLSVDFKGGLIPTRILDYAPTMGKVKQIFEAERHWFGI